MPINPKKGESEKDFISRCIKIEVMNDKPQKQAAAICYDTWKRNKK